MRPFLLLLATIGISQASPKNILFIAVDDLRPELGCYGAEHAQSPNIDRLAASGMLFENHYVSVPTCGASRYALLTGRSPKNSGVTRNNGALYNGDTKLSQTELPGAQSMPELFRRSGYQTTLIGKISHTADGKVFEYNGKGDGRPELPGAWDDYATPLGSWDRGWGIFFAYDGGRHRESGKGDKDLLEFIAERDEDLPDGLMTKVAVEKIRNLAKLDKPFFMGLGYFKPHLPFVAPKQDWEAFEGVSIPLPPHPEKPTESAHWHKSGEFFKYDFTIFPKEQPLPPESVRAARRAYLACVRYTDRQIGKVLDALDETGLTNDTIVVLWGDHGWNLGDSQMWAKHTPFERAVHSPLIIRAPGVEPGITASLVETTDIYPTLVSLTEPQFQETAHPLDGKSLVPILNNPKAKIRDVATSFWSKSITVRDDQFRLIATPSKDKETMALELYSLSETDGDPVKNLAPDYPEITERLLQSIRAH